MLIFFRTSIFMVVMMLEKRCLKRHLFLETGKLHMSWGCFFWQKEVKGNHKHSSYWMMHTHDLQKEVASFHKCWGRLKPCWWWRKIEEKLYSMVAPFIVQSIQLDARTMLCFMDTTGCLIVIFVCGQLVLWVLLGD